MNSELYVILPYFHSESEIGEGQQKTGLRLSLEFSVSTWPWWVMWEVGEDDPLDPAEQDAEPHSELSGRVPGEDPSAREHQPCEPPAQAQETGQSVEQELQLHHLGGKQPRRARPARASHAEVSRS